MTAMASEVVENHDRYLERKALNQSFGYDIEKERRLIIEQARPISGRILDAGTGKGYFTLALAQEGFHFTSFDLSESEQKYARLNLRYYGLESQVRLDIANAEGLPYQDGFFDVIFTMNMIHHLASVGKVCAEFIRVLSPNGKIILSDFNAQGFEIMDQIHASEGRRHEVGPVTLADTKGLFIERGFEVEQHPGSNQDLLIARRKKL